MMIILHCTAIPTDREEELRIVVKDGTCTNCHDDTYTYQPIMDSTALSGSVFSEALRVRPVGRTKLRIECWITLHLKLMYFAALRFTVFLDLRCTNFHGSYCRVVQCISRGRRRSPKLRIIVFDRYAIIPLIDSH